MHSYYVRKLLDPSEVSHIMETIHGDNIEWRDGRATLDNVSEELGNWDKFSKFKINEEAYRPQDVLDELRELIYRKLDSDANFLYDVAAASTARPMFTRTNVGGYYSPHHDNPINGHYSTTVFLSDPDSYDGGELCLYVNGESKKFKLDAGWAITYKTGTPHSVSEVTRGSRCVSVFWTKSKIADEEFREWYSDIYRAMELIPPKKKDGIPLDEALDDPVFILRGLINKFERKFTQEGRY